MRRSIPLLCLAVLALGAAATKANAQAVSTAESGHVEKTPKKKLVTITGTIGAEGKTLVSKADNRIWRIANSELLKLSEGRGVTVRAQSDSGSSLLDVKIIRLNETRLTAKLDDAAFRR